MLKRVVLNEEIFEQQEKIDMTIQNGDFEALWVILIPAPELSIPDGFEAIIKVFENVSYIGELRQR